MFAAGAVFGLLAIRVGSHAGAAAWTRIVEPFADYPRLAACSRSEPGHLRTGRSPPGGRPHWGKGGSTSLLQLRRSSARDENRECPRCMEWLP